MKINFWTKQIIFFSLMCMSGILPFVYAQPFDEKYAAWKAKQEAIDAKLSPKTISTPFSAGGGTSSSAKIALNSASLTELMQLSGVGEKKAQAIIDYRQQSGGFQRIEDIQKVKGIGPALFEKNKNRLGL